MVEDKNLSQDTVQISGHVALRNVSYKDVVEIKLADTVDSDNYGGNFVKDVCVDEGALLHRMISEEKPVDKRSSPNFSCQMIDANSDIRYGKKDDYKKSVHELKLGTVVPVDFVPDCDNEKQHSSGKEYDHEDRITTDYTASDPSEKKISLQELLLLESAEESRHASTINSESSEKHKCSLHVEVGQAFLTNTSEQVSKEKTCGWSGTISEYHDAAATLDVREPQKIDRYNPFIDHRLEDASEPEGSIPGITDAASTDSIRTVANLASGSAGLDEVETAEPMTDAVSSSSSDIQSSEKSNDNSESIVSKAITGAVDETTVAASSSSNAEPSDANGENQEKCASGGVSDQIDEEHCLGTDDAVSKSSTLEQDHSGAQQTKPESSKATAHAGNDDPSEPNFFGPSIMSGPVSMSGHIAYSGNVSLRSDSSTTSTRSFAFPVLQREWISSPVRMAKAERRRSRRRRVWRKGLICCKF
ncbi:uncharacterized protein LOC120656222 isoform X2 [Panicum virgatum]|uniref:Uncharacterized protein n=1 Tax=Panicum virgatum TaxID=38727 RepID=A0A8T0X3J4_PANVG|nr:uncharacterized protein LOC120656222 isoform X2 [Panicum virgatum]KAG2651883.1 hypothetical protein PVAP13_1NG311800 [Panicum virgatum]